MKTITDPIHRLLNWLHCQPDSTAMRNAIDELKGQGLTANDLPELYRAGWERMQAASEASGDLDPMMVYWHWSLAFREERGLLSAVGNGPMRGFEQVTARHIVEDIKQMNGE